MTFNSATLANIEGMVRAKFEIELHESGGLMPISKTPAMIKKYTEYVRDIAGTYGLPDTMKPNATVSCKGRKITGVNVKWEV